MNKNAEELYNELTKRGKFFDTPEAFSQELQTEDGAKFYYDLATKEGLWMDTFDGFKNDVLDKKDRKLFPNASWDNLSWDNIKKSFGEGNIAGEVSQVAQTQAEEGIKKAEQERIRQEKINLGISDKDKQDVMELVELEQKAANPISISTNGVMEVRTPKPELNQYGMPTKIAKPVNPDIERQVETKKAQMPAYLTRGENTTMDIAQNAYDRAMNTEEGKNIITSIQNKYVSEFKQSEMYKALLKDFYDGKATEDDLNNAFDEQYGQKMNDDIREGILGEKGLMREYYDDASNKLEARLHARDAFDVSSRIKAERDRQYEAFQNSIKSKRDENGINISVDIDAFKPDRMLNHAEQFNNDALDLIDAVEKERGFGKGIGNALVDIDTYTALAELSRTKELIDVLDKVEGDEALSEREELMLDAALNYFAVSSYYGDKLGRWYKAGQTTGASLPFIVQFMVTSGALAGAEAAVEGGAKSVGKRIAKNLVKHGYKKFARDLSSKAVTIPLAMLGGLAETGVEAGVMTAVFGLPQIEAGTQRRMLGHVKTGYNPETGKLEYLGREQQQTEEEARKNAMIDTYAEYLSEMVLTKTFSPLTDYIGTAKWFKDFQRDDVVGTIVDIWNNPTWKSARAATKFGSLPEEDLEEQVGGWMRLAFASDVNTMEDAGLDLDSQIDIVLGLAPTSLVFGGIGTASYYGGLRRNAKYIKQSLSSDAQRELFDKLMEESRSGQFGDLAHDMIRNIVLDNEMSIEDKKTNITSIVAEYQELLSKETQELAKEINKTENAANIDEFISNTRNGATDYIYQTIDSKGRVCYITDGEIGLSKSEDGLYRIDQPKKSRNVKVRYRMADGSFTEPFELSTAQLTAPVNAMNTEKFKDLELAKSLAKTTGEKTFEYDGVVYDTETGIKLGSKEEYAKKQDELQKKEEEENKDKEPVVSTRPHKIHGVFTVNLNGEEVTMKVFSRNATQKKDGSIKGGTFSISVDGEVVTGERREALVEALSNKFKADHAKAVEEYNQRKAEEAAANTVEPQPLISDEDRAAAAAEAQKKVEQQTILDSIAGKKGKNGNIDLKKLTPEEMVVHLMYNIERKDVIKLIGSRINNLHKKIADIEEDDKKDELEKYTETEPLRNELQAYEDAIVKWVGQDALETINAARAEALKLDTPPVQEGAPIVAPVVEPVQGETPAEPTVASEEDAPQDNVPAEPDTTPLPPAEPVVENGEVNEEEKEPMNLLDGQYAIVSSNSTRGKEQIVKVTQNEDGTETWTSIHDGKTVSQGAYKKQQFPEQDNMRVLGIKEGNTVTPVIVLSGRADLSQEKGELKVVPVNTKDGKIHEVHVSLLYKPEADGGWSLLKGVGSRVLSPAEAAKYNSLDALLDFPIIPNVTVGNFTLKDMLEYPTLGKLKARLDQLGIEYDKQTINTNLETALARWRELVRENNLNDEFQSNVGKLNLYYYNIYRAGVEPFKAGVPVEDTKRTRSNKNLYIQLDTIGMLPNNITNPVVQLAVLTDIASQLGIVRPKENGRYIDSIEPIIAKTEKEIKANEEEFTGKPKGTVEKADEDKQPDQQKPKAQKPKTETKEETPAPAQRKTNIDNLRDTFVEAYARTQNQSYNALQKTTAKNAFKGMIDKMSEEDAIALYLNLAMESAKSQGKMQEDMVNAAKALLDSKHGAAINAITGGAQQETNPTPVETTEEATEETEQTAEDSIDYEALVAERNELQETIYDMEDDEAANANARIAQINEILRNRAEFMVGDVVTEHTESTKRIIKILKAAGIRVVTFKNEDLPKYVSKKKLEELSDGQIVYGFASNDTIYLNEDHFNPNSPLHEFTHLFVTAYKQAFPNEWKRFVEIANKSALAANLRKPLKDGNASPYAKLSADEMASEVLSRYTGYLYGELDSDGRTAFENMMQAQTMEEKIAEESLLKRIRDFWKKIISFFDKSIENEKKEETIDDMIRQFAQLPMETLARGKEAVDKLMLNNTSENLDNSKKISTFAENNENYERTDEFRELQERSLGLSQSRISEFHSKERELSDEDRRRVGGVFQRLMDTDRNGGRNGQWINLTGKGNQFKIAQVNPAIFHDIFQICRNYLPNGELVDLHDNYADCKCFISEDGLCGFAIEPNGNLISVFSLNPSDKKGFLYAIKDLIRQEGATHLDCYVSSKQPLAGIYQKALGFHVASEMDYNMEYDHDNIAENHGMPKVAFMVNKPVEKKSFDENSYDEAVEYQQQNIERNNEYDLRQGNRAILRERFRDEELQGSNGLLEEAEASLQRGGYRSSPETTSSKLADFELAAQQEQELEAFAKENGVWIDDTSSYLREKYGEPFAEGGESVIYLSEDGTKVLKENSLAYFVEPQLALDRLVLHNSFGLSKIAPLTLTHFGRNENGEFVMIVEQPYIKGEEVTQDEIVEAMQALGYELYTSKKTEFVNKEEGIVINDLHDENVIRLEDGSIVVIDGDFRLNTSNLGLGGTRTTTPQVEDIDFMIGPAGAPLDPMLFDAEAAAKIQIKTHKLLATFANPKASLPEEFSAMRELVATSLDRTEGIRWMMESIEKFRKEHGMPELGEGFDVRTMVEAMDSKIQNDTQAYINTTEKRLRKNIKELADRVESSSFYKMHKIERELDQDGKEVELTALQMIERYLIACDSIEREQLNGNPRGLADFYRRMGMDVYEFAEAFNSAFFSSSKGKKQFDELWDSIRACTNVSIDMGWQSGLISLEEYTEYKKRRYYVPERDFAEVENNEELAIDSHGYRGKNSNKLTAMKQAKGGDSLAANVLANICLHARDGIIKSHRNAVKKAMFDLLRANEEWCREYKVPIPKQVWYQKNEDGTVSRMVDGPSAEDRKLMADLKSQIRDIENEIINLQQLADAATDESVKEAYENDIADLREQIDMLTDMFPYLDEFDTRSFIFMTNAAKNESTVMVYVDGVAQEMIFPNMSIIAKALNGTYNKEGEVGFAKSIGQYFAAGLTVYNPAFFTVNIVRDVPFIMKKGFAEYGFTFGARFIARMAEKLFNRELWKVVWNSDYKSLKDEHLREFFAGGANTGYTTIPEIRELKKQTKKWNDKKIIEWSDVKDLLSYMNTFSEVWTRSAAYSVVRDMGHTNEEAIKAAKNLSVNFNRKGLGNPFMNFFGSLSIFMNAAIQGACGYWRAFKGNEDTLPLRVWHGTRAAMQFMLLPAFTGFISTLLNPDDDDEKLYYSDYDRDNYALLGFLKEGIRIPLSEQVKPFWCMGVNIALGMQGRRTKEQITNSMVSTVVTNLLPLPPVLNSTIVMATNGLTGQKDFTPFQVVENMITPQALSGIYDLSNNVNFMGTDIRIEAGDKPQYMLGENEEYFCRQVAWWAYLISGGNRDYPSRTTTDGDKIWADWNPKQVSAVRNMVIPSTYRDVTDFFTRVIVNAAFPYNPYHGEVAKWEDFATVRRFYKPRDREMGMYSIAKDAKAIVKANNERKANAQKLVKGGAITKNNAMRDEAELRLRQTLSNRDAKLMSEYITVCEQLSIRESAKEYGLTEKQFMDALRKNNKEVYKVLMKHNNITREKAADKLLQLTRKYKSISIEDMTLLEAFGIEE